MSTPACTSCRTRSAARGRARCKQCLHDAVAYHRELRRKRRAAGKCTACASPVQAPALCEDCAEAKQARKAAGRVRDQRDASATDSLGSITREHQLGEVLAALVLLRRGRWTVAELAAELGQGLRTAYRMISALKRAGITVEVSREGVHSHYQVPAEPLRRRLRL